MFFPGITLPFKITNVNFSMCLFNLFSSRTLEDLTYSPQRFLLALDAEVSV